MKEMTDSFNLQKYQLLKDKKLSKSISFLLLFTFLISFLFAFKLTLFVNRELPGLAYKAKQVLEKDLTGIPIIEIKDGVTIKPEQRYYKKWKEFSLVIAPNENDPYKILEESESLLGLTRENLIIKSKIEEIKSEIKVYDLKNIEELLIAPIEKGINISSGEFRLDLTPDFINRLNKRLAIFAFPTLLILLLTTFFFSKLIHIFSFSIFSLIFNSRLNANLKYKQLLNIGIYALVPPTVLTVILQTLNLRTPLSWALHSTIYIMLIYKAIKLNVGAGEMGLEAEPRFKESGDSNSENSNL
ncbi:MAG: DUF1189 family protein [Candidatus Kaelpia aquatica]|nr:DUF1189 family protein [Candidatus Kaelpia aquatica]